MGKLTLIGCTHHNEEFMPTPDNYERVKRILEAAKPAFVSQEFRLFNLFSRVFEPLLRASLDELNNIEARILKEGSYAAEYESGIIYCRRNDVPLYWADLYSATQQEVVETNVLKINPVNLLWAEEKDIPTRLLEICPETGKPRYLDISERNVFTGHALSDLLKKYYPEDGVHICGQGHYNPGRGVTLQVVLSTCSFKPDKIIFEPKVDR